MWEGKQRRKDSKQPCVIYERGGTVSVIHTFALRSGGRARGPRAAASACSATTPSPRPRERCVWSLYRLRLYLASLWPRPQRRQSYSDIPLAPNVSVCVRTSVFSFCSLSPHGWAATGKLQL